MTIRKARVQDAPSMHKLINSYADKKLMLSKALSEIYDHLSDFFVVEENKKIVGCCGLHVTWEDLAEIRSLAVDTKTKGKGYGVKLMKTCHKEAKKLGVKNVFALTLIPEFFKKLGYHEVSRDKLPHKVWTDCIKCPIFPDCNEVPLMKQL
ncbi:MAG: N-acetyltransferase [Elusimicrobia bacterium]|nr:N-acetyltransferase [Elusimicrobiota bacterium]MBU2615320.1 N-acetyltransferase [Elusimicrobiota bacterium]